MRIIAGEARGRKIFAPSGKDIRPTSDLVKGAIFNILGSKVLDAKVLDLFAGTGSLGLESISRGAAFCVFVDNSREAVKLVKENIALLKYEDYAEVYNNDALSALDVLKKRDMEFDIIFLDPPYHKNIIPVVLNKIIETGRAAQEGIIVAEHDNKDQVPEQISYLTLLKSSVYGSTTVSFYKRKLL